MGHAARSLYYAAATRAPATEPPQNCVIATATEQARRMYIAMNRFKVLPQEQAAFRDRWLQRDSQLKQVPGFVAFNLLAGPTQDDHVLYASHTTWRSYADFEAWTRSAHFRAAHANAGDGRTLTIGHPQFEGFEVIEELSLTS